MKWLREQQTAIAAGMIASIIVVALQATVRTTSLFLHDFLTKRFPLRRVWGFHKPKMIYLVSGSVAAMEEGESPVPYLSGPSADAVALIHLMLQELFPKTQVVHAYSSSFPAAHYGENIVTVGGPINNACTRVFMAEITKDVYFSSLDLITPKERYVLSPTDPQSGARSDFGLILAAPNPFNRRSRSVVIAGCDSNGVLAAAQAMVSGSPGRLWRSNMRRELGRLRLHKWRYFYSVVLTRSIGGLTSSPEFLQGQTFEKVTNQNKS